MSNGTHVYPIIVINTLKFKIKISFVFNHRNRPEKCLLCDLQSKLKSKAENFERQGYWQLTFTPLNQRAFNSNKK